MYYIGLRISIVTKVMAAKAEPTSENYLSTWQSLLPSAKGLSFFTFYVDAISSFFKHQLLSMRIILSFVCILLNSNLFCSA